MRAKPITKEDLLARYNCGPVRLSGEPNAFYERHLAFGIPYDQPVAGYGGRTINTLRLWAAKTPNYFDFARFSSGDFVGALSHFAADARGAPQWVSALSGQCAVG